MSGLYFTVDGYEHPSGQVGVTNYRRFVSERNESGLPVKVRKELAITGVIKADSVAELNTAIDEMERTYWSTIRSVGLRLPNKQFTRHYINGGNSLTGIDVNLSFGGQTAGAGAEFVTGRSFSAVFSAEYDANDPTDGAPRPGGQAGQEDDFTGERQESVAIRGDGGARYAIREVDNGPPVMHLISQQTPVTVTQSGFATSQISFPTPNAPIAAGQLQGSASSVSREAPRGDTNVYTTRWSYQFISVGPQNGARPNT